MQDDQLFEILKECKNLPNFLNSVFGFLKRRTDFYYVATETNSPVGLPEGVAERCVKELFYKWKLEGETPQFVWEDVVPPAIDEVTIDSSETPESQSLNQPPVKFTSSESYNGAVFDTYTWSQTITDVDVVITVPENVTAKDISLEILPQSVMVKLQSGQILLDGILCEKVKHNDVIWSLDGRKLEIHLDKVVEFWWNCLVSQEPKIDLNEMDCSRPYDELSEEAQAKIEELSWNQEQKRLGLPTSEELVLREKLKKGWEAEGSPFKGKFDPNAVVFDH